MQLFFSSRFPGLGVSFYLAALQECDFKHLGDPYSSARGARRGAHRAAEVAALAAAEADDRQEQGGSGQDRLAVQVQSSGVEKEVGW